MTNDITEEPREVDARKFFEAVGLSVVRIPTDQGLSPDFLVSGDGPGYLVEAKGRFDDDLIKKELDSTGMANRTRPVGYSEHIEKIVRNARKQMKAYDPEHQYQWLVWLSVETVFAGHELTFEQFISTLYGARTAVHGREEGGAVSTQCFYARSGPFERWPEIDGALISALGSYMLCVNEFSPHATDLCGQHVSKRLCERKAVFLPYEREKEGHCFIVDLDLDRREEEVVRDYLRSQYGHPELQIVDFKEHSVIVDTDSFDFENTE